MAYVIGLLSKSDEAELVRRGWKIEKAEKEFGHGCMGMQMRKAFVDAEMFDIMNGPDWDGSTHASLDTEAIERVSTCINENFPDARREYDGDGTHELDTAVMIMENLHADEEQYEKDLSKLAAERDALKADLHVYRNIVQNTPAYRATAVAMAVDHKWQRLKGKEANANSGNTRRERPGAKGLEERTATVLPPGKRGSAIRDGFEKAYGRKKGKS